MVGKKQDYKNLKLKYKKTKKENRELKDKLNKEQRSKEKVEKDNLMLCNEKRIIEEKYQSTKSELTNMQQRLQEEEKRKKKKEQMIYGGIKYLSELVIMTSILYYIAKREIGQGTWIALMICLVFVAFDILVNAKMNNGKNNFVKCYIGLIKNLCQTILPLQFVFWILYVTKSEDIMNFIEDSCETGFILSFIVVFLIALLVITYVFDWLVNLIEKK